MIKVLLYADDSGILVTGKSRADIERQLSKDLEVINTWLVNNKLSLHLGKTESILFGSKPKIRNGSNLNISCNGNNISATSSVKYLGATLDQNLSGEAIAVSVIGKANCRLKFLYRKSKFLLSKLRSSWFHPSYNVILTMPVHFGIQVLNSVSKIDFKELKISW